ncbi:hypothetical protein HPB50_018981 [Hyalomma asiaticum]|uniref:Uncharacterized protein n=1 Tax=Hyalomma asiaticum TaxID=266040 RepID=A0ACB7RJI7_HYAAI|nr:hypothetical protein HPB50_018981 [Hyalomma asiaticum]
MARQRSRSSEAMVKFLKDRVESNQGISLQKLTGHLSQLPSELRTKYGCSVKSLKFFLQHYPKVFVIRNQSNVYVRTRSRRATIAVTGSPIDGSMESFPSASDRGTDEDEEVVTSLNNVVGTVYRIFNVYGFISVKYPIKTSVYFDVQAFENAEYSTLPSSGLKVNDTVVLDAKAGPRECEAKFRASRVARVRHPSSTCSSPVLNKCGDGGSLGPSPASQIGNQDGVIETVKANYGFIKFGHNLRERAFFHANNVDRSLGRAIKNLPDVFTVDDRVIFNAKPSKKPSDKVKWEATLVCLNRKPGRRGSFDDDASGNDVFMSEDELEIHDMLHDKDADSSDEDIDESPFGYPDWDSSSARADLSDTASIQGKLDVISLPLSGWEAKPKLSSERGYFYPISETEGSVKFGINKANVATASVGVTFHNKQPLENLLWEVTDGQEVPTLMERLADITQEPEDNFGQEPTFGQPSPPLPPHAFQPTVVFYEEAEATVLKSMECIATCKVSEPGAFRKIKFTTDCFFKDGAIFLGDLNEVLHQGSTVCVSYMVGVNREGKEVVHCDLVWQGRRPRGVRQLSPEEFEKQLKRGSNTTSNIGAFEDSEPEVDTVEEPPRAPSPTSSDEAPAEEGDDDKHREHDEQRQLSGASCSRLASMMDALPDEPQDVASSACFEHIPGSPGGCGDTPGPSIFTSNVNDEVLQRLAKMVAAEIIAERERTRIVLHDMGVQTEDEDSWLSSSARAKSKPPTVVSSSTQTLSTGGIKSEELFIN